MYTNTVSISAAASFCTEASAKREWLVTKGKGRLGTMQILEAPNVPARPKETLGTKFERKVQTSLCTTAPSPQTKSGRQTSLSPILLEERRWSFKG